MMILIKDKKYNIKNKEGAISLMNNIFENEIFDELSPMIDEYYLKLKKIHGSQLRLEDAEDSIFLLLNKPYRNHLEFEIKSGKRELLRIKNMIAEKIVSICEPIYLDKIIYTKKDSQGSYYKTEGLDIYDESLLKNSSINEEYKNIASKGILSRYIFEDVSDELGAFPISIKGKNLMITHKKIKLTDLELGIKRVAYDKEVSL